VSTTVAVACTHCRRPNLVAKANGRVQTVRCEHCSQLFTEDVGTLSKIEEIGSLSKSAPTIQAEATAFMAGVREQIAALSQRIGQLVKARQFKPQRSRWRVAEGNRRPPDR
jgi:phage FluMu protein Com